MSSRQASWGFALGLLAWAVGVVAFAMWRVPYDDEWFTLTLVRTDWPHFTRSLLHDFHPPWTALLDRGLMALDLGRAPLHAVRGLSAALGVGLLASLAYARWRWPWWVVLVAALHPIVFYYAGAARWYPYVFLAQALRTWALWHPGPVAGRKRGAAFFAGATLGPAAGYVDLGFLVHDAVWWVGLHRRTGIGRTVTVPAVAGTLAAVTVLLSDPVIGGIPLLERQPSPRASSFATVSWAGLGLAGEAHPPWPWAAFGALPVVAAAVAVGLCVRGSWSERRLSLAWLGTTALIWTVATTARVWHPRYSLLLWIATTALVVVAMRGNPRARPPLGLGLAYLVISLGMTLAQTGFIKADLNALPTPACDQLLPDQTREPSFIVAPYPRIASSLERRCEPSAPVQGVPYIRHHPDAEEQLAQLRTSLANAKSVVHVDLARGSGSWMATKRRVRRELHARCELADTRRAGMVPHLRIKETLHGKQLPKQRFVAERWVCGDE